MPLASRFCRCIVLILCLGAMAYGQAVVTDDANTSSAYPTKNFGSSIALLVCTGSNTYIKFNLANLGSGVTGSNVSKATLILYTDFVLTSGTMDVYQVNGSWSEGKITWNNAPALGTELFSAVPVSSTGYLSLDLTSTVQAWLNGTLANNGIALVPSSGTAISVSFDSKENLLTSHTAQLPLVLVSAGPQGPQGQPGPQGPAGPQGATGTQGPQGPQGPKGETAATGPQGATGATGAQGPAGAQGPKGDAGAQGPQGPAGTQGVQGPIGPMGPAGPQGSPGPMPSGAALTTGPNSFSGNQTINGNLILTGASGIQFADGTQMSSANGSLSGIPSGFGLVISGTSSVTGNVWSNTSLAPMPTPRDGLAVAVLNGLVYAIGGLDGSFNPSGAVEVYDPVSNSWTGKAPLHTARTNLRVEEIPSGCRFSLGDS